MTNNIMLNDVLSSILFDMGISASIDKYEIDGLMDSPGHHWSNPGIKQLTVYAGEDTYQFVLKTLAEHSKREIAVYNYLTTIENHPIPRIYHSVYNDKHNEYWMIIERCLGRDFPAPEEFWKECGTLLARIHSVFWGKTETLLPLFYAEFKYGKLCSAVEKLSEFLNSLSDSSIIALQAELAISLSDLKTCLETIDKERLIDFPVSTQCLLHGSFRSPEIMWRETPDGYESLGVDWEACRIGHPSEDLAFGVQNLLPKEEFMLFDTFMDSYTNELAACEIQTNRENLVSIARKKALIKVMDGVIPFLIQTYMKVRNDESYRKWCDWLKSSLPDTIRYIKNTVDSGSIYSD